jgi:hypothetical protein
MSLPLSVDDVTPRWLSEALGVDVESVTVDSVVSETATKMLVDVRHDGDLPSRLRAKGGFGPELRPVMGPGYVIEAYFYRDIAPLLGDGQPIAYFADAEPEQQQGVVAMADLRAVTAVDHGTPGLLLG